MARSRNPASIARAVVPALMIAAATTAHAESTSLAVSNAWAPPEAKSGASVPLYMSFSNSGPADALLRIRCPVANFTDKRTTDVGEGGLSAREVKAIPIPPGTTVLKPEGTFIQLLDTTQPLAAGETFSCKLAFQSGESREVEVTVKSP